MCAINSRTRARRLVSHRGSVILASSRVPMAIYFAAGAHACGDGPPHTHIALVSD